jgi:hypothetical protein
MNKILFLAGVVALIATTGCIVPVEERHGYRREEVRPDVIVGPPAVLVRPPEVIVR